MTTAAKKFTAEELLRLPGDGFRFRSELVKGELRKYPLADAEHGFLAAKVGWKLAQHVESHKLGQVYATGTGFQLASNPDTVRAPDVAFVSQQRIDEVGRVRGYWPGAPDMAIEVVSPHDTHTEVQDKVLTWLDAGTRMVVVVNPRQQTVAVYRSRTDIAILTRTDTLDGYDVVPGWTLPIADLFA
jgi:Uma2 family endonuclease